DGLGCEVQRAPARLHLVVQALDAFAQLPLDAQHGPDGPSIALSRRRLQVRAPAQHGLLDLGRDDRANLAQVLADRLDLACRAQQELQVALKVTRLAGRRSGLGVVPLADEVVDA